MAEPIAVPICPKCGAAMVMRNRKSDGVPFWGCSGFPACGGIRQAMDGSPDAATATSPIERTRSEPFEPRPIDEPAQEARPIGSAAGASARAEFGRRAEAHRTVRRKAGPYILAVGAVGIGFCVLMSQVGPVPAGPIGPAFRMLWLVAIFPILATVIGALVLPSHATAWRTGAEGEEAIGRVLARLEPQGYRAIHDRRIPGSRANIDHIVVGPTGVFVIETKSYEGRVRVSWGELRVGRWRKTEFIEQAKREAAAVEAIVLPVPVTPLLCFRRADTGWEIFPMRLNGVRIVSARKLPQVLRKAPQQLSPAEVADLADRLDKALKRAG